MALFKRKKKPKEPPPPSCELYEYNGEQYRLAPYGESSLALKEYFNLQLDDVKARVGDDSSGDNRIRWINIESDGDIITGRNGNKVVFSISKRQKAYETLAPYIGKKVSWVTFWLKEGNNGQYYKAQITIQLLKYSAD